MDQLTAFFTPERVNGIIPFLMNVLIALAILIIGLWFAKKVKNLIIKMGEKSPHLDSTLFKFLGSIVRYIIMAFVFIAVLGRFGVETTSIVALLGCSRFGRWFGLARRNVQYGRRRHAHDLPSV